MLALDLLASDDFVGPGERFLQEPRGAKHFVRDTELQNLFGLEHTILLQRVFQNHLQGVANTDQIWQQVGATPARNQANKDFWESDGRSGLINGSVVGVKRNLQATTQSQAVNKDEAWDSKIVKLFQRVMPDLCNEPSDLAIFYVLNV